MMRDTYCEEIGHVLRHTSYEVARPSYDFNSVSTMDSTARHDNRSEVVRPPTTVM